MADTFDNMQPSLVLNPVLALYGDVPAEDSGSGWMGNLIGQIHWLPFTYLSSSELAAQLNGGQLPTADYGTVYDVLGNSFGGNATNMALPDLTGATLVQWGQGPNLADRNFAQSYGSNAPTLQTSQMPPSLGGTNAPVENSQASVAVGWYINVYGIFPTPTGGGSPNMIGAVHAFAGDFVPYGAMPCDGRLLPIFENEALFQIIGTTYGGDGEETFALPDLRGRSIVGAGTGPDGTIYRVGQTVGTEEVTLGAANLPSEFGGSSAAIGNHGPGLVLTPLIALQGIYGAWDEYTPALGEISFFAGDFAPKGYAIARGQQLPINQNQALFSLIGTTYGGNGQTTFALPNLQGRVAIGDGPGYQLGQQLGSASFSIGFDNMPGLALTGDENANALAGTNDGDTIRGGGGDDTLTGNGGNDQIDGGDGNDILEGGDGNDWLAGKAGDDTINGGAGDDILYGGEGNDSFDGGSGTDTLIYRSFSAGLTVTLTAPGEGTVSDGVKLDTFTSIEKFVLGSGNDHFIGSSGDETVEGGGGNDTLSGGGGNDGFVVGVGSGVDSIDGGDGYDTIIAGTNSATIVWGTFTNIEAFDGAGKSNFRILGTTGNDNVDLSGYSLSGVERIDAGAGADTVIGSAGDDRIDGGLGNDSLIGGNGNDTFLVRHNSGRDTINGGGGTDTIRAESNGVRIDWTKVSSIEVVNSGGFADLQIIGTSAADTIDLSGVTLTGVVRIDGGAGADTIIGSAGSDTIAGGAGDDSLSGGNGNDVFLVRAGGGLDYIAGGSGTDTIRAETVNAKVDWTRVSGIEAVDGAGFAGFSIVGSAGADILDFSGVNLTGVAKIDAGSGNDVVVGSSGADTIVGGLGADTLTGGGGNDVFAYTARAQSGMGASDHISDFSAGDKIDISSVPISGGASFTWIGTSAFGGTAGELRYFVSGGSTVIQADTDGNGRPDFQIYLDNGYTPGAGDFVL